jgi:hypothetical protein
MSASLARVSEHANRVVPAIAAAAPSLDIRRPTDWVSVPIEQTQWAAYPPPLFFWTVAGGSRDRYQVLLPPPRSCTSKA